MAVTAVRTYYVDVGSTHAENTSGVFYGTPHVLGGGTLHPDTTLYRFGGWIIGFGERVAFGSNGPSRVLPGTLLGNYTWFDDWAHYIGGTSITATGGSFVTNEGQRIITLKAVGGSVASPSLAGGGEIVPTGWAFPVADISAHTSFATITAGNGLPNTGTLTARGYAEGVWDRWSWTSGVITSGSDPTEKTIVVSLVAGYGDGEVKANFTRSLNPGNTWSPKLGNVVIHLLGDDLVETHLSTNYTSTSSKWSTFLTAGNFTALSCKSGGITRNWRSTTQYDDAAYLLNVETATLAVTMGTGGTIRRVYAWKLENPDGTFTEFGSGTTADMYNFADGCKIHLYLTTASPYPKIVYDGFDPTGVVPENQNVKIGAVSYPIGSIWTSPNTNPLSLTLSPEAWATRLLGQSRTVIVDAGNPVPLANIDGTSAPVVSGSAQFNVTRVKFKQVLLDTDGVLTVDIKEDTVTPVDSITVRVSQENSPLGSLTADGTLGFYVGSGNIAVSVDVDYGSQSKSDFVVTVEIPVSESYDGDVNSVGDVQLSAAVAARSITVNVLQKINYGAITSASMNISRTVGAGEPIPNAISTDSLLVQCYAGSFSVTRNAATEINEPITVECYANPGYRVKTLLVYSDDEDVSPQQTYRALPAKEGVWQIESLAIPSIYDGKDIKFVLVMEANIVGTPLMLPMAPDDLGKFSARTNHAGTVYADFRVGDSVTLTVDVVEVNSTPLTGAAIGSPTFNGVAVIPVRDGTSVEVTVTLGPGTNVFKIPVYAVLETATAPAEAGTITLSTAWSGEDTLFIDPVMYRRIGSVFTVTAPLASTNPATYTLIAGRVSRRAIASGFGYVEVGALLPVVAGATTRTFTSTLRGPSEFTAVYAIGVQYPAFVVAAYDYGAEAYITQGVRPVVATTPVSPAALSDNLIADLVTDWPESGTPGTDYRDAAFLYREVTTTDLLPGIDIRITSAVGARLEVWNSTTSLWLPYSPTGITLADAFTYFRVSIGDAPENLVSVAFETAVRVDADGDETEVPGCKVYAASGAVYDGVFVLPSTIQARSRTVLHARATAPGYIVTGWYIDGVLSPHGASLSVVVPDTGLTLKPRVEIRQVAPLNVMVLNANPHLTDDGMWVSKLFRAQYPWKPLTANVVVRPSDASVMLGVLKDGGDAPEELDTESPGTVAITVTGDGMRRLPPGQIQKTRFVRYMVLVSGVASVASVAIGSGAETMKGGH